MKLKRHLINHCNLCFDTKKVQCKLSEKPNIANSHYRYIGRLRDVKLNGFYILFGIVTCFNLGLLVQSFHPSQNRVGQDCPI